jgi:WD40 repeat protein
MGWSLLLAVTVLLCARTSAAAHPESRLRARHVASWGLPGFWHQHSIYAVSLSPDAQHAFVATQEGIFAKWALASRRQEAFFNHEYRFILAAAALSNTGRLALGRGLDGGGSVEVYDPTDGKLLHELKGPSASLRALAFSGDGSRLAASADAGPVLLWDLSRKGRVRKLLGPKGHTFAVALSADGSRVMGGSADGVVRLWDGKTGRLLRTLRAGNRNVLCVALSPDGRFALSGGEDRTARLWDLRTGKQVWSLEEDTYPINAVTFSQDGNRAVISGGSTHVLDVQNRQVLAKLPGTSDKLALSADGSLLAVGYGSRLQLLDTRSGEQLWKDRVGHTRAITSLAISADGTQVASGSDDASVRLWDPVRGISTRSLSGHEGPVVDVAFSRDGATLLSSGRDGTLRAWETSPGEPGQILTRFQGAATALALSPTSPLAVLASDDGLLRLWNLTERRELRTYGEQRQAGYAPVVFSSDGQRILAAREDRGIDVWDVTSGKLLQTLMPSHSKVTDLASNEELVSAGTRDGVIHHWKAGTLEPLTRVTRPGPIQALALDPKGIHALSAGEDYTLRLWEAQRGAELDRIEFHLSGDRPTAVLFEPDGRAFFVGTDQGLILRFVLEDSK